ncbi:EF-hand domain-containing protein [Humisphaera borealis]|uniref:EF-hand domain-containing protein n=1 Tax=Humisphaera borealis TaxID=2807512 RepID=A0A7M2WRA6_9BACT|nr:EF-hand domain-containing protein [Humisphaera borealis]QOV88006.1 EF-hand domain-containing protein [Humisphaera borealis]
MRIKTILSLAIAATMTISGMSLAADGDKPKPEGDKPKRPEGKPGERPAGGPGEMIKRLDTDKDGKISKDEAKGNPRLTENFAKLDANSDGFIDEAEFKAAAAKRGEGKPGEKKPEGKKPEAPKA